MEGVGILADHFAPLCYISEQVFVTTSEDCAVILKINAPDPSAWDQEAIDAHTYRIEQGFRPFDERFRLYQYAFSRQLATVPHRVYGREILDRAIRDRHASLGVLYEKEIYYVLLCGTVFKRRELSLSPSRQVALSRARVKARSDEVVSVAEGFVRDMAGVLPCRMLNSDEGFRFLRRLANFSPESEQVQRLNAWDRLNWRVCDSNLVMAKDHLRMGDRYLKVLSLKDVPYSSGASDGTLSGGTRPNLLGPLLALQGDFFLCSEWHLLRAQDADRRIRDKRRAEHHARRGVTLSSGEGLTDQGKVRAIKDLGGAQAALYGGSRLGRFSLVAVAHGPTLESAENTAAAIVAAANARDCRMYRESDPVILGVSNQVAAYLSTMPGNMKWNFRDDLYLFDSAYADASFCFGVAQGEPVNAHLGAEYLAVLETEERTPYYLNLHDEDLGHTAIVGRSGSGKSFLLNFLMTQFMKYEPLLCTVFDLGGSFRFVTQLLGGSYFRLEPGDSTINPFDVPLDSVGMPSQRDLEFLAMFVRVLIEATGPALTTEEERDIHEQITSLYMLPSPTMHRLGVLASLLLPSLRDRLRKWTDEYGWLFDNERDELTLNSFQCYDFSGMAEKKDILEPLLFYVLHRVETLVQTAPSEFLKVIFLDESWAFLRNPALCAWIERALKTFRKANGMVILATQSLDDLRGSPIVQVIRECCASHMLLANPQLDREDYREWFGLTGRELEIVPKLKQKQQLLFRKAGQSVVLNLRVDRRSYFLYANDKTNNMLRQQAFDEHGFEKGLEVLSASTD